MVGWVVGWVGGFHPNNKATSWPNLQAEAEARFQLKLKCKLGPSVATTLILTTNRSKHLFNIIVLALVFNFLAAISISLLVIVCGIFVNVLPNRI